MNATRRLNSPREILRELPHLIEFDPGESAIIIPLDQSVGESILRFDLPPAGDDPKVFAAFATTVVGYICQVARGREVIVIITTQRHFEAPGVPPWSELERSVHAALLRAGIRLVVSLCRAGDGWGEYACDDDRCSGFGPRPLNEIAPRGPLPAVSATNAAGVLDLLMQSADAQRQRRVDERIRQLNSTNAQPDITRAGNLLRQRIEGTGVASRPLAVETTARVLDAARNARGLAAMIDAAVFGPEANASILDAWRAALDGACECAPSTSGGRSCAFGMCAPGDLTRTRLDRCAETGRTLLRCTPASHMGSALTILAALEWSRGRASIAAEAAMRALEIDPANDLAASCSWISERGIIAPWLGDGMDSVAMTAA